MISVLEQFRKAREILSTPDRWTRRAYARDANGRPVPINDKEAKAFCILGALARAGGGGLSSACRAERMVSSAIDDYAPDWNDDPERTYEEVIAVLDAAIEKLSR